MGCTGSKLDDLQAVALCRDRASRLDDAIRLRYALADAHVHYLKSLRSIGESLHFFFDSAASSPLLPLPQRRKLDPDPIPAAAEPTAALHARGHSHSGSHIEFLSESETGSPLSGDVSPFHADHRDFDLAGGGGGVFGRPQPETQYFFNYMRSQPPPAAVTYEQPPPASVYMSDPSTSSATPYGYAYPSDYAANFGGAGGGGYAGFFGSPPQGGYYASSSPPMPPAASASGSRAPPPPPPSPPQASTWDFLNPFETFERFYQTAPTSVSYTPSRDSREVREEEGIPELEEVEEVVKEVSAVHGGGGGGYAASGPPPAMVVEDAVDKNVVGGGEPSVVEEHRPSVTAAYKAVRASLGTADAVREIKLEFERAADSGRDVAKMLEAGKLPYHRRNAVHKGCHFFFLGLKTADLVTKDHSVTRFSF